MGNEWDEGKAVGFAASQHPRLRKCRSCAWVQGWRGDEAEARNPVFLSAYPSESRIYRNEWKLSSQISATCSSPLDTHVWAFNVYIIYRVYSLKQRNEYRRTYSRPIAIFRVMEIWNLPFPTLFLLITFVFYFTLRIFSLLIKRKKTLDEKFYKPTVWNKVNVP